MAQGPGEAGPGIVEALSVLVVDDEDDIRNLMALHLRRAGFRVLAACDGGSALALARKHRPPVVLLDRMLPDMPGTEICLALRQTPESRDAYIIMVTARTEEDDRIEGFEVGADDYVSKPFSVRELVLRVQAAARRVPPAAPPGQAPLVIGALHIDPVARKVQVSGTLLEMTVTEYKLLLYLARHNGKLCERGELLREVWELPPNLNTRTVDTHIKRLRHKLGPAVDFIETVRGAGYRFQAPPARP